MTTLDPLGLLTPPPRRSRRWLVIALVAAALVLVGGGTALALTMAHKPAAVTATTSPSPSPSQTTAVAVPPPVATTAGVVPEVQQACDLNDRLDPSADLPGLRSTVYKIDQLVTNVDSFDVRFAGHMLKDRYDLAVAARRGDRALSTALEFTTAHIQLSTACIKAGWHKS